MLVSLSHTPACPNTLARAFPRHPVRGGLVFKAHSFLHHSTLDLREIQEKNKSTLCVELSRFRVQCFHAPFPRILFISQNV